MNNETINEIIDVMSVVFNIPQNMITEDSSTLNIESWDSLKHMSLIVSLEEKFNCEFSDEQISNMTDFKNITEIIDSVI